MLSVHPQTKAVHLNLSNYALTCRPAAAVNKSSWSHHFINCILIAAFMLTIWETVGWSEGYLVVEKRKWTGRVVSSEDKSQNDRVPGACWCNPIFRRNSYFFFLPAKLLYLKVRGIWVERTVLHDDCVFVKVLLLPASWYWIWLLICWRQPCWHVAVCLCLSAVPMDAPTLPGIACHGSKAGRAKRSTKLADFYTSCNLAAS